MNKIKKVHPLFVFLFGYILYDFFRTLKFVGLLFHSGFSIILFDSLSLIMIIALCAYLIFCFNKYHSMSEFSIVTAEVKRISMVTISLTFASFVVIINFANFTSTISDFHVYVLNVRGLSSLSFNPFLPSFNFLILTLFCAPIIEEILIRGVLQKYLTDIMKNPIIPIVLASIVFSIIHWQFSKIPFHFLSGILFGCIYYKTKKIIIPIIAHAFWNLLNTIFIMDLQPMNRGNSLWFFIFIIAFGILANHLYKYKIQPEKQITTTP